MGERQVSEGANPMDGGETTGPGDPVGGDAAPGLRGSSRRRTGAAPPRRRARLDEMDPEGRAALRRERRRRLRRTQIVVCLCVLLAMGVVRTLFLQAFYIPSVSMQPALEVGDRVLVNKMSYRVGDVRRGQVIVFDGAGTFGQRPGERGVLDRFLGLFGASPSEDDFIKRVIGLPGDRVRCCDAKGRLQVNGISLDEPYLYPFDLPSRDKFDIQVQPGRLWVMGDHRSRSADSRAHLGDPGGGTVPMNKVIGRAVAIVWPFDRVGRLPAPSTFEGLTHGRASGD
jgi:signal peptidase I